MSVTVDSGDCLDVMRGMAENGLRVDSIVTDPPYHLTSIVKRFGGESAASAQFGTDGAFSRVSRGFMGKQWDGGDVAFRPETWRLAWQLLPPGGYLVAFGGTRTYHRLACAIEDAGFEIRDQLLWLYASGFPKSHDVSKAIDKASGIEIPVKEPGGGSVNAYGDGLNVRWGSRTPHRPFSVEGRLWAGWGTALKPACEPIVLARKPLAGSVAANVLAHGTGALNIDGCRVHAEDAKGGRYTVKRLKPGATLERTGGNWRPEDGGAEYHGEMKPGRWPANVLHDGSDEVEAAFAAFGERKPGGSLSGTEPSSPFSSVYGEMPSRAAGFESYGDGGTAARFFFSGKAGEDDRCDSRHPTVKPVALMRWLCRLVTPPNGLVLDPFAGSGTTGVAAIREGFRAKLIEQEDEYVADIRRRLARLQGLDTPLFGNMP